MRYFNENDAKKYAEKKSIILENYDINKTRSVSSISSVFLSHSNKDAACLRGVIAFLKNFGADVYIDLNDITLPQNPSQETAKKLKEQIQKCSKVVVLVSENSKDSKWIPWEVGIADMDKTSKKIALLPKTEYESAVWPEQEYMGLYNPIINEYGCWYVKDVATNKKVSIEEWLRS